MVNPMERVMDMDEQQNLVDETRLSAAELPAVGLR